MKLQCNVDLAASYKSGSQIARILSEDWCSHELYCPACDSDRILSSKANTPAVDFACPLCEQRFQLKNLRKWGPRKVVDAGYEAMIAAIRGDRAPHLLLLHYTSEWFIQNVLLVPRMFFTERVIEKRRPLSQTARRAGWVGCNILLSSIPEDGKIPIVSSGVPAPQKRVRLEFERIRGLGKLRPTTRGWTVDVHNAIRRLGKSLFSLQDVYGLEHELQILYPQNRNVRPKIRQQLQILRDLRFITFEGSGNYSLR